MVTHSSTLAWKIPWTEEPGGLQSMVFQDLLTKSPLAEVSLGSRYKMLWPFAMQSQPDFLSCGYTHSSPEALFVQ